MPHYAHKEIVFGSSAVCTQMITVPAKSCTLLMLVGGSRGGDFQVAQPRFCIYRDSLVFYTLGTFPLMVGHCVFLVYISWCGVYSVWTLGQALLQSKF